MTPPRVAFFTDSFHEINGVAHTSRCLDAFARRRGYPFLSVHGGDATARYEEGATWTVELKRGPVSFGLERDLQYDLLHWRHLSFVKKALRDFRPDLVHITGPGDMGQLGAYAAHALRIPTVASWHTNVHEFGGRRLQKLLSSLSVARTKQIVGWAERKSLDLTTWFYHVGRLLFAPNEELAEMLRGATGKPIYLMGRGVDTELFSPAKRQRHDGVFRLGYVGRLSPEKNVRFLATLERHLIASSKVDFEFVIVGEGGESTWLKANMQRARFTGTLQGEALARAYADMDLFVFPSRTDTFGNVVLEALASGVPAVVTAAGGPKFIVRPGITGIVALDDEDFIQTTVALMRHNDLYARMRQAARATASQADWNTVFDSVYRVYAMSLQEWQRRESASPSAPSRTRLEMMREQR